MKAKSTALYRAYLEALRVYLQPGCPSDLSQARSIGERAVKRGIETLDLARIHTEALLRVVLPHYSARTSDGMVTRASAFFAEAITPLEETHRGAREANAHMKTIIGTLTRRTGELAASNEELRQEIVQRKAVEKSLRTSELTSSQLLEKSRQMQDELRYLSHRLLSVQEEERKRISRELHDVIAQTLAGINLRLVTLKSQATANAKGLHQKISITQQLVQKSVDIVHRFARDLRPTVLDDLGLIPALRSHLKSFRDRTGIRVAFTSFAGVEKLDGAGRTALYRVAQEALNNVATHSGASHARVRIVGHDGGVRMEIRDNGKGFRLEGIDRSSRRNRLGLLGMRERVEMVGGAFCVESAPGKATTIRADIPLRGAAAKKRPLLTSGKSPVKKP